MSKKRSAYTEYVFITDWDSLITALPSFYVIHPAQKTKHPIYVYICYPLEMILVFISYRIMLPLWPCNQVVFLFTMSFHRQLMVFGYSQFKHSSLYIHIERDLQDTHNTSANPST